MILGFSKHHGMGGSKPALDYLTGYLTSEGARATRPQILRGDRETVATLIDSIPFQRRYTSGVLSFHADDRVTPKIQSEIMDRFEDIAFAGLERERRSILWVRHDDKDARVELHFIVPKIDLATRKSINIAPPTPASRLLWDTFRSAINLRYGFRDPDRPECQQLVSIPGHVAKLSAQARRLGKSVKPDVRQAIAQRVLEQAQAGRIRNRADSVTFLKDAGFSVTREGVSYLTVELPGTKERIRLKGDLFREHWSPQDLTPTPRRNDPAQLLALDRRLQQLTERRATYHRARYKVEEETIEPSVNREELKHDRTRNSFSPGPAADGASLPGTGAEIRHDNLRLNDAAQYFRNASHNLERAGEQLDQAHRTFARDFDQAVIRVSQQSRTEALVRRHGLAPGPQSQQRELELELDLER